MILTGPVQSGKTRFLTGIVSDLPKWNVIVSGFLSPAAFEGGRHIGYDLFILGRKKSIPYIRRTGEAEWERVGPYFFIPAALEEARRCILESRGPDLLIVDEVGPLEIGGGGVWSALETVLTSASRRCLLVVREVCLGALLGKLGDRPFGVFRLEDPATRASLLLEITGKPGSLRLTPGRMAEERSGKHVG
jgi:nucleoside-triphosphatase